MPAVFVHGVPDTQRVWDAVASRLNRKDVLTLSLPGFDCPMPAGFSATKEAYVDWLLGRLAAIQGPIDLVGHDWGGLLVVRAVSVRPDAVRSWAAGAAPLDREYVWQTAAHVDPTMKDCILKLYRSAIRVGDEWEDDFKRVSAPGLVLWGEKDPYAAAEFGARLAQKTRARFMSFPGCSHWWQLERPAEVAAELARHWTTV